MSPVKLSPEEFKRLLGDGSTTEPPKDKVVHVHNWYHRGSGGIPGQATQTAPRYGIQFSTIIAFVFGWLAGFVVALLFMGR